MTKPIFFNTDMVQAILEDRKTVTRRVIKPQPKGGSIIHSMLDGKPVEIINGAIYVPPFQPGDILYVRETWRCWRAKRYEAVADIEYKAGGFGKRLVFSNGSTDNANRNDYDAFVSKWLKYGNVWRPSIHMPKEIARLFLKVKDVCAERLHDSFICSGMPIFNIQDEGIVIPEVCEKCIASYDYPCCGDEDDEEGDECGELDDARYEFSKIWDSTIKPKDYDKYGWSANPWVWVIEFERTEKPNGI